MPTSTKRCPPFWRHCFCAWIS